MDAHTPYLIVCIGLYAILLVLVITVAARHFFFYLSFSALSVRKVFHVAIFVFSSTRLAWAIVELLVPRGSLSDITLDHLALSIFFISFFLVLYYLVRRAAFWSPWQYRFFQAVLWSGCITVTLLNISYILYVRIERVGGPSNTLWKVVVYYTDALAIICNLFFVTLIGIIFHAATRKTKFSKLAQVKRDSILLSGLFALVCLACFASRMTVFGLEGSRNSYLPNVYRYLFGYILSEFPMSLLLVYIMKKPPKGYRTRLAGSFSNPRTVAQLELGTSASETNISLPMPRVRAMYESKYESQVELVISFSFASWQKICPYVELSTKGSTDPSSILMDRTEYILQPTSKGTFTRTLILRGYNPDLPFVLEVFNVDIDSESDKKKLVGSVSLTVAELVDVPKTVELIKSVGPSARQSVMGEVPSSQALITCCVHKAVVKDTKNSEVIKGYVFKDTFGNDLFVREYISESPFAFAIPYQVLRFVLTGRRKGLSALQARHSKFVKELSPNSPDLVVPAPTSIVLPPDLPTSAEALRPDKQKVAEKTPSSLFDDDMTVDETVDSRHLQVVGEWFAGIVEKTKAHVDLLEESLQLYANYDRSYKELSFKPSPLKTDRILAFVSTNLHIHELRVPISEPLQKEQVYDFVTFGAPSAHIYKFNLGLRQIRAKRAILVKEMERSNEYHSAMLARKVEALDLEHQMRFDVAVCQAVSAAATSLALKARNYALYASNLDCTNWFRQIFTIGFLFQAESLLSTHGAESSMLGDMDVAVNSLRNFTFTLVDSTNPGSAIFAASPKEKQSSKLKGVDQDNKYPIIVPVPHEVFIRFPKIEGLPNSINVHPVLFTQGINEQQTLAIAVGSTILQEEINKEGYVSLCNYFDKFAALHAASAVDTSQMREWQDELSQIGEIITSSRREKNIEILARTADFCRALGGGRATSCKSAKDRTSMSVTWEEARILERYHGLAAEHVQDVVQLFRSAGVRRENCVKNIGLDKYAFHPIQMRFIPKVYRAPKGTGGANAN